MSIINFFNHLAQEVKKRIILNILKINNYYSIEKLEMIPENDKSFFRLLFESSLTEYVYSKDQKARDIHNLIKIINTKENNGKISDFEPKKNYMSLYFLIEKKGDFKKEIEDCKKNFIEYMSSQKKIK